jgi:hypothetical protein
LLELSGWGDGGDIAHDLLSLSILFESLLFGPLWIDSIFLGVTRAILLGLYTFDAAAIYRDVTSVYIGQVRFLYTKTLSLVHPSTSVMSHTWPPRDFQLC